MPDLSLDSSKAGFLKGEPMSLSTYTENAGVPPRPTGFRRLSHDMLVARDQADRFEGLPRGTAKPLLLLMAFQEAEPYLGLPAHAFKLVSWLVKQTMAHDWEAGSRPIAWPSARLQQEFLGLSAARVKALNRLLFEAGIFVLRDNEQGKRYGRRGADKRIIEAYGFDLSPIAQRAEEFVRLAAAAKTERSRMKALRGRVTMARRAIRQAGELLAAAEALPATWGPLAHETAELVSKASRCELSGPLEAIAKRLEALQMVAEQWIKGTSEAVDTNPEGLVRKPHNTTTNSPINLKDTVIAAEESSEAAWPVPKFATISQRQEARSVTTRLKLGAEELLQLVPKLREHVFTARPVWNDIVDTAGNALRHELGISASLWAEACQLLGRDGATLAIAIVATKEEGYFTTSAGGYFGGMVRRAAKGELWLEKSLWGLRQKKYGRPTGNH